MCPSPMNPTFMTSPHVPRVSNPELLGCIIRARVARGWRGTRRSGAVESSARVSRRRQTSPFELTVRLGPVPRTLRALERGRWRRARGRAVGTFGARLASNLRSRPRRRVTAMERNVTLLDLVNAVAEHACSEAEVIATVVWMVNRGHVRLCGTFKGARFDLTTLTA